MSFQQSVLSFQQESRTQTLRGALFAVCCLLITGCAVLMPQIPRTVEKAVHPEHILKDSYEDYVGVLHVHTNASHDAHGTFEDVVRTANAQNLDFVGITEHNTLKRLHEGKQGWHGATLMLIGTELSLRAGHYLVFGVTEEIDREHLTTQEVIDEVNRQGGIGFIAHPYFPKRRWTDWEVSGFTGIEVYNAAHDTLDENRLRLILWTLTMPPDWFYLSLINRPYDPLRAWDSLIVQHGPLVGIGSTDAHEFHMAGIKFAAYHIVFQLIRTHLLISDEALTPEAAYSALRTGHAYLAIELIVPAKGFRFFAQKKDQIQGIMGDSIPLQEDLVLTVAVPAAAQITLFRDGRAMATTTGVSWQYPITQPGVYRVEVTRHETPWIFSNPIYVIGEDVLQDE